MIKANVTNKGNYPEAASDPYARALKACKNLREYNFYIMTICVFIQLGIDGNLTNTACVLAVYFSSLITFGIVIRANVFRLAALPGLIVVGFNVATLSGALVAQTFSLNSLTSGLKVPEYTFPALILFQIGLLVALTFFLNINIFSKISNFINSIVFVPLGLMSAPFPLQVWIMGGIGLTAMVLSIDFDQGVKFGDASAKFIPGFSYLAFAPFLLPALPYFFPNEKKYFSIKSNYKFLLPYFVILIVIGISANTRGGFAGPVTNLFLVMLVLFLLGQFVFTGMTRKLLMAVAAVVILGSSIISDVAIAMLVVRSERDQSTAVQLISKTFDAFHNKKELKSYLKLQDSIAELSDYDEKYISNPFIGRLIVTKFADNMLSLRVVREGLRAEFIWDITRQTLISLFPTPVLRFFGSSLDKENLRFSIGDLLYAAQYGTDIGINNYKLGSSVAHGLALMGVISYVAVIPMFLFTFIAVHSLTLLKDNIIIISPVILMQIVGLYYMSVGDSYFAPVLFLFRTFPQGILIYLLTFYFSRLIAGFIIYICNPEQKLARY